MEYIDGKNLGEILLALKHGLPVDQTVFIISQICKGLDYSHTKHDDDKGEPLNIVHRDISPQNMLISYQGEVKISDFGISKAKSDFIAFLDDDDKWHSEKLKIQMKLLETYPETAMASSENIRMGYHIKIGQHKWIRGDLFKKLFIYNFS